MILNKQKSGPALTNVAQTGEFRIRNSAKAFSILSSGLYANKIRAIIRELSCNAVDSHIAAGKAHKPFDVHLPNAMEPWFSVTDHGVGLSHDQVLNIYTTYFESTKTDSNDYIGALGLGSKSPFSYTDNFSVTAVKDGVKNIYSAFINESGVPSVSLMATQSGKFPNGVEVKFPVSNQYDYSRFMQEAREVFKFFTLRPNVTGYGGFEFIDVEYVERDIIPGVHQYKPHDRYNAKSFAVMGNIAYPIEVPNATSTLGELAGLLDCTLIMHFELGELDFQASREGLSYIPETIAAIKKKLEALKGALAVHLAKKADTIDNLWEKARYLQEQAGSPLFKACLLDYVKAANLPLNPNWNGYHGDVLKPISFAVKELESKYNINARRVLVERNSQLKTAVLRHERDYDAAIQGHVERLECHLSRKHVFVLSDCRAGQMRRVRQHFATRAQTEHGVIVVLLEPAVKTKKAKYNDLLQHFYKPERVMMASELDKPNKVVAGARVGLFELVVEADYRKRRRGFYYKWIPVSDYSNIKNKTYVPLKNKTATLLNDKVSLDQLMGSLKECGLQKLSEIRVFGVRKFEIEKVEGQPGWTPLEEHIRDTLKTIPDAELDDLALHTLNEKHNITNYKSVTDLVSPKSPLRHLVDKVSKSITAKGTNKARAVSEHFDYIAKFYRPDASVVKRYEKLEEEYKKTWARYPLLKGVGTGSYGVTKADVAQYINLIDKHGV